MNRPRNHFISIVPAICLLLTSSPLGAVAPLKHGSPIELAQQLESVVVEVNGEPTKVNNGGSLQVVAGDRLTIKSAVLVDHKSSPEVLNFRGYRHGDRSSSADDRGLAIKTDSDLRSKWSVDGKGETYFIIARSKNEEHGRIRVEVSPPKLERMVLEVNGKQLTVKEGEKLHLAKQDKIKLVDIITNIRVLGDDMTFNLVPVPPALPNQGKEGEKRYEMQLRRRQKIFARIDVLLDEK